MEIKQHFKLRQGENFISMGEWGNASSTINVHDSATINTGALFIAKWNDTKGTLSLYDNAQIQATDVSVGRQGYRGAMLNMYNNSKVTATGIVYVEEWDTIQAVANMGDSTTMTAGELRVANDNSWGWGVGILNTTGNSKVFTTTDNGGTGDLYVGYTGHANGTLNIQDTAEVSVANRAIVGRSNGAIGQINMSGNGKLTASEIDVSVAYSQDTAGAYRRLNISGNGQVKTAAGSMYTGNFNQGASAVTVPGNVTVSDNGYLEVGGNHTITYGTLTVSSTTGNPVVKVLGDFILGATPVAYNTTGTVVLGGNGTLKIGNTVSGAGNLILVNGTLNTSALSTTAGTDGRVQLTGGSSAVIFNGGTISPTASNASFMQGLPAAYVNIGNGSGGAIFNTAGFNITVAQNLATDPALFGGTDGGLTKQGAGTMTLKGNNTYNGGTNVNGGVLEFANADSIPDRQGISTSTTTACFVSPPPAPFPRGANHYQHRRRIRGQRLRSLQHGHCLAWQWKNPKFLHRRYCYIRRQL